MCKLYGHANLLIAGFALFESLVCFVRPDYKVKRTSSNDTMEVVTEKSWVEHAGRIRVKATISAIYDFGE